MPATTRPIFLILVSSFLSLFYTRLSFHRITLPASIKPAIRIHIYVISICDIPLQQNYLFLPPRISARRVPLRLPSFTFFTTDRSEDGTVINSLLLCRFFAVIHNYCNARSAARTVLFNFTDKSRLRLSKWKNRSHSCFSIILASVSFVRGLEIDEKR